MVTGCQTYRCWRLPHRCTTLATDLSRSAGTPLLKCALLGALRPPSDVRRFRNDRCAFEAEMNRLILVLLFATVAPAAAESQWPNTERLALFKAISEKCPDMLEFPDKFYSDALEPPFWHETQAAKLGMQEAFAKLDA